MILFVVDQVAGAEYLLPYLLDSTDSDWMIVASPASGRVLQEYKIPHLCIEDITTFSVRELLQDKKIFAALLSTSISSRLEREFLKELLAHSIPCAQLVDYWSNYKQRFNFAGIVLYPDKIFTLDANAKNEMADEGIPEGCIEVVGQPFLEMQRKILVKWNESKAQNNTLLLITQPVSKYYLNELGYSEFSFLETAFHAWKKLNRDWAGLTVVVHPAEPIEKYQEIAGEYSSEICVQKGRHPEFHNFARVLGMFSLLMMQSTLAEVPTASLQPGATGEDLCFLSRKSYIPKLRTVGEVVTFLTAPASAQAIQPLVELISGSNDRLREQILFLIEKGKNRWKS